MLAKKLVIECTNPIIVSKAEAYRNPYLLSKVFVWSFFYLWGKWTAVKYYKALNYNSYDHFKDLY